jgi:glutathione peroxidase
MQNIYHLSIETLDGKRLPLARYRGTVLLLVNTASECALATQLRRLEQLYKCYKERGFEVIGFPCNQFGGQEPGDTAAIQQYYEKSLGVSFTLSAKIKINGTGGDPLWRQLVAAKPGLLGSKRIRWNFTKFLINREGHVLKRFAPYVQPEALGQAIETALAGYPPPEHAAGVDVSK